MAQKTQKEETEFKVPETLTSCINNCGVTGNPASNNMCQTCFTATNATVASSSSSSAASSLATILNSSSSTSTSPRSSLPRSPTRDPPPETSSDVDMSSDQEKLTLTRKAVNRCSGCRRKVGSIGFQCRCGELFCWEHRYSDCHDCNYDYKSVGWEAIARENPVVKATKIVRV
ncbi:unnamed protein product [Linum tenue]|uniref:Zinc finger A20 and AN1 domain-containing stress-associated protein 5-like n=1 Tax=Linum tenue TaxID=586396 RepID=A0AAV0RCJ7_9ROSI|nr:unnamed protein product [Linum tenue]